MRTWEAGKSTSAGDENRTPLRLGQQGGNLLGGGGIVQHHDIPLRDQGPAQTLQHVTKVAGVFLRAQVLEQCGRGGAHIDCLSVGGGALQVEQEHLCPQAVGQLVRGAHGQ